MRQRRIWIVSDLYWPTESATGYYMSAIARGLASHYSVSALCSRAKCRGENIPRKREYRDGVDIQRLWVTSFNKNILLLRLVNVLTASVSFLWAGLRSYRRNDIVIVVTNPPSLPLVTVAACLVNRAKCLIRIDDIYPDILVASGLIENNSLFAHIGRAVTSALFRRADRIIVLGRDMKSRVSSRLGIEGTKVNVITNWADEREVVPDPEAGQATIRALGLEGKFIVQCAGNIGRVQGIETILEAALLLRGHRDVHFLFIGEGAKKRWLERQISSQDLQNVSVLHQQPRAKQREFLNVGDVGLSALIRGMLGVSVPSRFYNLLAAGKPVILVAEAASEIALTIDEEKVGWVVGPGRADILAETILLAKSERAELMKIGKRARKLAETRFSYGRIMEGYVNLIRQMESPASSAGPHLEIFS